MKVTVTFKGGVHVTAEVSDKYKVLSEMMYSDERFSNPDYDKHYCELVNQCVEEIVTKYDITDAPIIGIVDKKTDEEMMADDWA